MITPEMIEEAAGGKIVYFVGTDGRCMRLWQQGQRIRVTPVEWENCKE